MKGQFPALLGWIPSNPRRQVLLFFVLSFAVLLLYADEAADA